MVASALGVGDIMARIKYEFEIKRQRLHFVVIGWWRYLLPRRQLRALRTRWLFWTLDWGPK